jgi:hypothetical protein
MAHGTVLSRLSEGNWREDQKRETDENNRWKLPHRFFRTMIPRSLFISFSFSDAFQFMCVIFFLKENLLKEESR